MKYLLSILLLAAAMPAAHAQNFLERLNSGLQKANQALGGNAQTRPSAPAMLQPSEQQIEQLAMALTAPGKPDDVLPMYEESRNLIGEILLISSCDFTNPRTQLNRFSAPDASLHGFVQTNIAMRYHPSSQCLDVQRVDGWTLKARNAFRFRALYASAHSGESTQRHYELVKQPDGAWLLGRAGTY